LIEGGAKQAAKPANRFAVRVNAGTDIAKRAVALDRALDVFRAVAARRISEAQEREHHLWAKIPETSVERFRGGALDSLRCFQCPAQQLVSAKALA
jgi:hypothetical protein